MWISRTLAAAGLLAVASGVAPILMASAPDGPQPVVYLAEIDGIIHPVSAEYLPGAIAQADAAGAALVVITLRTPGGLVDSTRDINTAIIAREDAGRRVRRPVGFARGVRRLPDHDGRRRRRDGAGDAHRRRPSRGGQRREDRRDDGQEDGLGRRRLRPHPRDAAQAERRRWSSRR